MTLAFFGEPRMPRLSKLLLEVKQGEILIPRFQRPFVWTDEQRLALLGSIYSGYPIGAILVWRTQKHRLSTYENLGPLRMPLANDTDVARQYLLDGHQRMTTLFAALGPALYDGDRGETPSWTTDDPNERSRWSIYFDLMVDDKEPFRLRSMLTPAKETWLPLDILLDPYKLNEFGLKLQTAGHDRKTVNRVQSIAEKFRDYQIPVMPMASEDIKQVTVSFKRINSGGSRMNEVHMVNALTHGHNFDFLKELETVSDSLKSVGWEHFDKRMILNVCKTRLNIDFNDDDAETLAAKLGEQPKTLTIVGRDLRRVARHLGKIARVRSSNILPYGHQAVLLADALRDVEELSEDLCARLKKWFWATTLSEYFDDMPKSLFERARQHLYYVVAGTSERLPPDIREVVLPVHRFDFRSARCRGIGLLLAEQPPRSLEDGKEVNGFQLLAVHGVDALSKLVAENELEPWAQPRANGPENRFLIAPRESKHLKKYFRGDSSSFSTSTFASHAIYKYDEAKKALSEKNWSVFLSSRRATIELLERSRAEECGLQYHSENALAWGLFAT